MSEDSSPAFATYANLAEPLRVVLVGAGGMGLAWLNALTENSDVELVAAVDLNLPLARKVLADRGLAHLPVGSSVSQILETTSVDAVVNVTVPGAHHPVNTEALFAGLPVLCEKPIAPTVAQALSLAAASEASGQLLMTSQSRRYFASLCVFRDQVRSLGQLGIATTEFFKAPRFGGFRDEMDHVLLVDMAIHSFDAARYVLDSDPVAVYCEEFNPGWSWYSGAASAAATFEFENGIRYVYTGSWCSDGLETSWNGSWRVNGSRGSASWDGESTARIQTPDDGTLATAVVSPSAREEIRGSLAEFVAALRAGTQPSGEIHSNILSLAMVEGAVRSAEQGERILIQTILDDAYAQALAQEARSDVLAMLSSWGSASNGLSGDGQRMPLLAPATSGG